MSGEEPDQEQRLPPDVLPGMTGLGDLTWTMTEPLPLLIDSSVEIAWDYLNRTGELGDPIVAGRFLSDSIELMVRRGERRRLMLANKAIAAYQQFRRQHFAPVLASA